MQHQLILCHLAKKAKQMYNQKKNKPFHHATDRA